MNVEATGSQPTEETPPSDYDRARVYLQRATWAVLIVVAGIIASLWLSQTARVRAANAIVRGRHITRAVLSAELAIQSRANAVPELDSLAIALGSDPTDTASIADLAAARAALTAGDGASARARLASILAREDSLFERTSRTQPGLRRASAMTFLIALLVLIGIVIQLRRRLSEQLDRAVESRHVIESQNERLRAKRDALAAQTEQLQSAATEMEIQAAELEEQTMELEATIEELRDSERSQRGAAEESALLARRLAEAQRVAQIGYWEIDSTSGEVFWSDEMYALAGIDPAIKPPPSDRFIAAVHPDDRSRLTEIAENATRNFTEFTEQYRLPSRSSPGAWRTVQARGRIITDQSGARRLVGTVQDITDRVLLETQLRRSQKMEAVGQLAGGIAHDFNNILTVIEGYSSLLLSSCAANDPAREDVEEIRRASARAATLTRQLLAFSRQQVLQPRVLDLNAAINSVDKMLRRLIGEHIDFRLELADSLDTVRADPGQLEQVIVNLVVNARDAMPSGGVLTISTGNTALDASAGEWLSLPTRDVVPGAHVMLTIADTGIGISPEHLEQIFEPFFTTKESGKGTGLGLSTVHGIIEQSGGHIHVQSEVGVGTSFTLYFPRVTVEQASDLPVEKTTPSAAGSERVLLVEDDPAVRTVAGAVLRRAGYTVIIANNGAEALRICDDPSFTADLVVTDMVMPGMGGRDLSENLRRMRPELPVLFMSGYTRETGVYNSGLAAGEFFIEKPFTPETLTRKVRETLDRAATRRAS